ncbi:hypothetical protein C5S53_08785 [Methanophagales archaeon]|nr:hypothetical protein C5S53_08785 [Methanophagales archaeon]
MSFETVQGIEREEHREEENGEENPEKSRDIQF